MSENPLPIDKISTVFGYLLGLGVMIGGAIMGVMGYRNSKYAAEPAAPADEAARDAEIARLERERDDLQRSVAAHETRETLEAVMKATREAIYFKLDQGFTGLRTDITALKSSTEAGFKDVDDRLKTVDGRLSDLERARPRR